MRILLVNKFHYLKGGSEKYYFELGKLLKEKGHEVAYFSMKDPKNISTGEKEYFVEPIDLNNESKLKAIDVIYSKNNKKNKFLFALWCLTIFICIYMECSTGIQGTVIMLILYLLPENFLLVFKNQFVAIATMIGCSVLLILKNAIINIPVVQYLIVNILHESSDLNSRLFIYNNLYKIMKISPFWGFGAENNYVACQKYLIISQYEAAPDAQNGLIDWLISYGSIGTVVLLIIVFLCFVKAKKNYNLCLMGMLYVFFILGSRDCI